METLSVLILVAATALLMITVHYYERITKELRFEVEELRDELDMSANVNSLLVDLNRELTLKVERLEFEASLARHPATRFNSIDGGAS